MAIHGNWHRDTLLLWSDDASASGDDPVGAAARLRDKLSLICTDELLPSAAQATTTALWLPGDDRGPAPAPARGSSANGTTEAPPAPLRLGLHRRAALQFSPAEAMDLLIAVPDPLPEVCGDSIRYWSRLARFVAEHLRRRLFFPTVVHRDGATTATWRLILTDRAVVDQLERFTQAMPPSCRAIHTDAGPPDALELVESFLTATIDALVRRSVSIDPFFTRVHALAGEADAQSDVRWVSALLGTDHAVRGSARENALLSEQIHLWTARLDETTAGMQWQLGFELIEPALSDDADTAAAIPPDSADTGDDVAWRVVFRLHPLEDGEAIDAAEVWSDGGGTLRLLGRNLAERREMLLAELQRAAETFPPLSRAIGLPAPSELSLTTAEAHLFLRQWSLELRKKDFIVHLPDWAENRESRLSLVMALRPMNTPDEDDLGDSSREGGRFEISAGQLGLDSLLQFDWKVAVGGVELSPEQFEWILGRQSSLIRHGGRWIEIDRDAAQAAAETLRRQSSGKVTLGEAFRSAYGLNRSDPHQPTVSLTGTSWIRHLLEQTPAARLQEAPQPEHFGGTLRPYQLRGLQWLVFLDQLGIGGCLADDMGLGKTIQLIALLLHERNRPNDRDEHPAPRPGPTLLFAPTSVVGNWVKELERFAPSLKVILHHGADRLRGDAFIESAARHDIVITSYALAYRDIESISRVGWHRVALDEAQKIKNPSAASSVAIRSIQAPHRVAMTGTPIENHLSELWSIMDMLNPNLLGSAREFRERFAVPIEKLSDQDRAMHLKRMIRPFVLRRTKLDPEVAGDLPEKMEMKVFCTLTPEQATMYQRVTGEMLGQIDSATGIRRRGLILAVLTRLKQICDHPVLVAKDDGPLDARSGKCERLVEMLEEVIEEGDSALVFTQYREMGHLLERILPQRLNQPVQFLHGGTPQKQRDEMVRVFQSPGTDKRIFILSLRAGGLGLNLTAATHVFHFDRWWNPAVEQQATDRAYRIGQQRRVQVHKFVSMGTVEERIDRLLSEKMQLADNIVGSGDEWLTSLSTAELTEYLKLTNEAIGDY